MPFRKVSLPFLMPRPLRFKPVLQQQVLGQGRAHFAYSNGKIIARDNRRLICLDLFSEEFGK